MYRFDETWLEIVSFYSRSVIITLDKGVISGYYTSNSKSVEDSSFHSKDIQQISVFS